MPGNRSGCPGDGLSGGASGALDGAGAPPLRGTSPELSRRVTCGPGAGPRAYFSPSLCFPGSEDERQERDAGVARRESSRLRLACPNSAVSAGASPLGAPGRLRKREARVRARPAPVPGREGRFGAREGAGRGAGPRRGSARAPVCALPSPSPASLRPFAPGSDCPLLPVRFFSHVSGLPHLF